MTKGFVTGVTTDGLCEDVEQSEGSEYKHSGGIGNEQGWEGWGVGGREG